MAKRFSFGLRARVVALEGERDRLAREQQRLEAAVSECSARVTAAQAKLAATLQRIVALGAQLQDRPTSSILGCDLRQLSMHRRSERERQLRETRDLATFDGHLTLATRKLAAHRLIQEQNLTAIEALKRLEAQQRRTHTTQLESAQDEELGDAAILRHPRREGER